MNDNIIRWKIFIENKLLFFAKKFSRQKIGHNL